MDELTFLLSLFLMIAVVAVGILIFKLASLKSRMPALVEEQCQLYRRRAENDLQQRLLAHFSEWRETELQTVWSNAQRESLAHARGLFDEWRQNELETIRREQREIAMREASNHVAEWKQKREKVIRHDAVLRSKAVTAGKITEHLVPHLPNFSYNPKDARFIGSPVDFIVFDGLSDEESDQIRDVVFIEVKTGVSALTKRERLVRDAIKAGRVKWLEWSAGRELPQAKSAMFE
jgi:predicted Holliday junction resolvase-like endonuclease